MKVLWRRSAIEDLDAAREYLQSYNPTSARRVIERIEEATHRLAVMPYLGKTGHVAGTRELVVPRTPYRLVYRILDEHLEIVSMLHGARELSED
ncbi:type II toxin-antitoxin system RelE/ParE family toxin [Gloeobacter morelensis]|uniref:Type II toxin-antitoxin system RelE/ParE family toxin n=1 Tax=Gloeobacter morelensis MG652769 TaxID=2781736 RepID=A0ABY3PIV6_9CYAN|nr:type II toxin-antitoxin system RelE/ParE family toxin [Gloeobacter morelensis]UFP93590.1 type II toxin-antitoxin system RelE/ParE family toxin [Gloeobacter morelensis MG652769]